MSAPSPRLDVYTRVTDQIIEHLERGVLPWQASWKNASGSRLPLRGCGIPYRGVNILLLWMAAQASGYNSPIWLTFKQALALGGCVRKGEKGTAIDDFTSAEAFYATLCHELVHWTQQTHRLDRVTAAKKFEDSAYARLELEAEIGAAYLSACFGFAPFHLQDHAAYIGDWLTELKGDKRAIFTAASSAQKAVDYLLEKACMDL